MGAIGLVDTVQWYEARAKELADWYETASAERVHSWLKTLLPSAPATILDVGAGSGRDAAWLAGEGYEVVAVEPSAAMRETGQSRHGDRPIQWIADSLPALERTFKAGLSFDVILLSAVWMHVAPTERARAFRKLVTLLRPGGLLAITLRSGPADAERGLHEVSADEIKVLARDHGAFVEREGSTEDHLGRYEIQWTHLGIRLPDDGTGALPLLRHIILQDEKSSTYKLGLLRTLCRIADGAGGFARPADDDHVAVPMGLVALTWIRLYKPLLAEKMPQSPSNLGYDRLGFAKEAFRKLAMSHHDLRVGMRFIGNAGTALHQALKDVVRTIDRMPATHITYPNDSRPIFRVQSTVRHCAEINAVLSDRKVLSLTGGHGKHPAGEIRSLDAGVERAHATPVAAAEAQALGHGGIAVVARATGLSRTRIARGLQELRSDAPLDPGRVRRPGGGRKRRIDTDVTLLSDLNALLEPVTAGAPDDSPLRWTSKSIRKLAVELQALGHSVSPGLVNGLLHELGYTLQANRKTKEGTQHPDRDAQFHYLNDQVRRAQAQGQPVISVDTKKKELIGNFKNGGGPGVRRAIRSA